MKDGPVQGFPEPDHVGSQEGSAFLAVRGDFFEWYIVILGDGVFLYTPVFPDVSMELDDFLRACPLMEPVDVLCDQRELRKKILPGGEDFVSWIGFFGGDDSSSPVIPFPYEFRVLDKCRGCGELLGSVRLP